MPSENTVVQFAPDVPDSDRARINSLSPRDLAYARADDYRPHGKRVRTIVAVVSAAGATTLATVWALFGGEGLVMLGGASAGAMMPWALISLTTTSPYRDRVHIDHRAMDTAHKWRGHYLRAGALEPDATELLNRLQKAASRIIGATAAAEILPDASPAALAEQTWQVAQDLTAYSKLRRELPSSRGPAGEQAAAHRALIDDRFTTLEQRVAAVEALADTAVKANGRLQAERRIGLARDAAERRIGLARDAVLDLAAGGARDELAIAAAEQQRQILTAAAQLSDHDSEAPF